jgi:hypothetical protein
MDAEPSILCGASGGPNARMRAVAALTIVLYVLSSLRFTAMGSITILVLEIEMMKGTHDLPLGHHWPTSAFTSSSLKGRFPSMRPASMPCF